MSNRTKFEVYHANNPKIYELFEKFTLEAIASGKKKLSAWLIINRIRWEVEINTVSQDKFKISNNNIAYYSRLFMEQHPAYKNIFNTKKLLDE